MKTKIIPFDLETAKKIQAGEIEGRVMSNNAEVHIIDLDMYFRGKKCICAQILGNSGKYITNIYNTDGTDADFIIGYGLYIELQYSDNDPQFKPFDRELALKAGTEAYHKITAYVKDGKLDGTFSSIFALGAEWMHEHLVGTTGKPKED